MTISEYPTIGSWSHHRETSMNTAYGSTGYAGQMDKAAADCIPHSPTTGPLAAIDSSLSEAMCELDHLEIRLALCLRSNPPTNLAGKGQVTAVPESELVGRLFSASDRLGTLIERIRDLASRVTL